MNTQVTTKFKIYKPSNEVFEAIIDPLKIGNFWFSSSSESWEQGKSITLRYDEYEAEGIINVLKVEKNKEIKFSWGEESNEVTVVTITLKELDNTSTIIEVNESGLNEHDPEIVAKCWDKKKVGYIC